MQFTAIALAAFAAIASAAPQYVTGTAVVTQTMTHSHTVTAYEGSNGLVVIGAPTPTTTPAPTSLVKIYWPIVLKRCIRLLQSRSTGIYASRGFSLGIPSE